MRSCKLGLIGAGISNSRAPELHRSAGRLCGLDVSYELIDLAGAPAAAFDQAFDACRGGDFDGINVTHPFKQRAVRRARIDDPDVARLGAINTVVFGAGAEPLGFNTDYTGFIRAYTARFDPASPGRTGIVGAGGVARAIGFALAGLGATEIRLFDRDCIARDALAAALGGGHSAIVACDSVEATVTGVDGLVNATPLGMHGYPGTAIPAVLIGPQRWAFDAVYTPVDTPFLRAADNAGLDVLSGYELFFYQGVDAFERFAGRRVEEGALRRALAGRGQG